MSSNGIGLCGRQQVSCLLLEHITLLEAMYWAEGISGERLFHSCIPFPQGNAAQAGQSPF